MFNDKQPEDIFSAVDKSQPAPVQRPTATVPAPIVPPAVPPAPAVAVTPVSPRPAVPPTPIMPSAAMDIMQGRDFSGGHRWWIALPILGLVIAVVAGYLLYQRYIPSGEKPLDLQPAINETVPAQNVNELPETMQPVATEPAAETLSIQLVDSDLDGLDDTTEAQYGTNPLLADSDLDGLFDKEEIEVYRTDPLNADSDGDSYKDGEEVRGGYNPLGPGRLFDVPIQ